MVVGGILGVMGLVTGLCNNAMAGPDGCSPDEVARQELHAVAERWWRQLKG